MPTLYFDCETYSECDLFKAGTHKYAEHPSTEITVVQWAVDDEAPFVADTSGRFSLPGKLLTLLIDTNYEVVAHNSSFDRTMLRLVQGIDVPIHRWRDTMVKALAHGLPGGLDKLGVALGLSTDLAKDRRGKELIHLFCKPRPKNHTLRRATPETHPTEWAEFLKYSRQDIIAMRAIDKRLPSWNYRPGHPELALWHLDQKINDRGFLVDVKLADGAIAAVKGEQIRLKAEVHEATDGAVTDVSRRDTLLRYILSEHGVTLPDMKRDTLERRLNDPDLPEGVRYLIALRLEAAKTSVSKYFALKRAVNQDGRLCNTIQFCGAARTGRDAGRIFQPQNLKRPDMSAQDIDTGIVALTHGIANLFDVDITRVASNSIRGSIIAPPGMKLVVADLSNIEGRSLAWLAGEHWKVKAFDDYDKGTGMDLYYLAYARAFNIKPEAVTKDQRQIGKVMELGLGFGGGVSAFITFAVVYGMDLNVLADAVWETSSAEAVKNAEGMLAWVKKQKRPTYGLSDRVYVACEILKRAWRDAHPSTEALWQAADSGVRQAIANPGEAFSIGKRLQARRDGMWLRIRLPSGRYICYADPKINEDDEITYAGVNQYTRQWGRIKTYGGKAIENATQAFARDVFKYNQPEIDKAGYEIVLPVHDELITQTPDTEEYSSESLSGLMAHVPPWAEGLPLAAAGFQSYRYRKG